ncbi:hypothetical protein EIMP300_68390 [Escherichia coli]|uniref:Uncharacterized protein n=1 Tax=Escherichia coli TaxID=562 RepID=A0A8S0FZ24_ECOLX|nr:hypothetical protein EIMP300_68390 [Escherichia coli]
MAQRKLLENYTQQQALVIDNVMARFLRRVAKIVTGGIVFFTATIRNRKNSNTGRDKFSAYLTHLISPFDVLATNVR